MIAMRKSLVLLYLFIAILPLAAHAQSTPVAQWRSVLPYSSAVGIAHDGVTTYVATRYSFYTRNNITEELTTYSKVNGMSDIGMSGVAYDDYTGSVILTYTNSNIDIFKNGMFYNIPDLKIKTVTGTKAINGIYVEKGLAYLSTDVGIVVIDLAKVEVKETYTFSKNSQVIGVRAVTGVGNNFYAATVKGLYRAPKNSPKLQAFSEWQALDTTRKLLGVAALDDKVFTLQIDTVFAIENDTLRSIYTSDSNFYDINPGIRGVWVLEHYDSIFSGMIRRIGGDYSLTDSMKTQGFAVQIIDVADEDSTKFFADQFTGLKKRTRKGEPYNTLAPDGPSDVGNFDIIARDGKLIIAHGSYDDTYVPGNNSAGFSVYENDKWKYYRLYDYTPFGDSVLNFTHLGLGPDGTIYAGSTESGLFLLKPDGGTEYYKQNSFISPSSTGGNLYRVSGIAFDNDGVLWITVLGGTPNELVARTTDGQWYPISVQIPRPLAHAAAHLAIDDNNQKWFAAPRGGGLIVYDDNHTPANILDDASIRLQAGEGSGGLPDNEVFCITKDKDGSMWIGTANGIGIVNCPGQVIQRQCEAEKRIVQFDQFAGYLFQNEQVRTIAVDGANRKWIGTNNGVWLISSDGDEIITRFTKDNSPLPSDIIQKIVVDGKNGDVYIGTESGLMVYRGTATDGVEQTGDLITFPNPVPSGYSGTIAINGFVENADVRITDISGQLIYRTTAHGGQAVWNGMDYTGRRPQSGVYLIFGSNKDGSATQKGKMVFMQ